MLGFDAIGRLAIGQAPKSAFIYLPAGTGSYLETGNAATFKITFAPTGTSYALTGSAAMFTVSINAVAGSYAETGSAATFAIKFGALATGSYLFTGFAAELSAGLTQGTYLLTGNPATFSIVEAALGTTYGIAGNAATLTRDFVNWFPLGNATDTWSNE